jgi:rhodanese-related sulfurtransferase
MSQISQSRRKPFRTKQDLLFIGFGVVFAALLGLSIVYYFSRSQRAVATPLPKEISVTDAYEHFQTGSLIVDVREKSEWIEVHIPNAILIPLADLGKRLDELPKDQEIVVICRSGNRSQTARDILLNAGFERVTSMAGGIKAWKAAGYPTVEGE